MRRLYELDAIRGAAALVVAFHHLSVIYGGPGLGQFPAFAVDLFFVLSGYVMARTYEGRMRDGSLSTSGFLRIRYRRLFWPLAIGSTIGLARVLLLAGPSGDAIGSYALVLAFLPTIWLSNAFWLNLPAWSLFLEISANTLHGALLGRLSLRALWALMVGCTSAAIGLLIGGAGHWDYGVLSIMSCFPRELAFYLVGIVVFRRWGDGIFRMAPNRVASALGAMSYPLYATHVPVMGLSAGLGASPEIALVFAFTAAFLVSLLERLKRVSPRVVSDGRPRWPGDERVEQV